MKKKISYLGLGLLSIVSVLTAGTSFVFAQSNSPEEIVSAIEQLETDKQLVFSGSTETPEPEGGGGIAGVQMMIVGAGQQGEVFEDDFEVVVSPEDEEIFICSKKPLPGVAIYQFLGDTITSTTFGEETFATEDLANDLAQIVDLKNLKRYVGKAEDCKVKTNDGMKTYSCPLSKRFIRSLNATGPQAMLAAAIIDINAEFTLDEDGDLTEFSVEVTREDPMGRLMKMGNAQIGGNLGELDPEMKERIQKQFTEKKSVRVYRLKLETKASSRSTETLKEMRSLVEQ